MFSLINFLFLSLLVSAPVLSVPLKERDVVAPPVTAPNATSTWSVGSVQTVVWDTSMLPPDNEITNKIGQVVLGHLGGGGLNLMLDNPLASGFKITQGSINVVVPNVPPRNDYIVVLFGDSGNTSPAFAITGGSASSTSSTSQSSSTSVVTTSTTSTTRGGTPTTTTPGSTSQSPVPTTTVTATDTAPSSTTPSSITPSSTFGSSTTVVVLTSSQPSTTSATSNGATSMHRIGATCLGAALIVSGLLL
ncbi:hypothetical protein AX15_003160 [Amanita polypyramis BW_CC]|nr:hypothetical protein AX15_003160 [Amanita polypyramis BW_CC]